VDAPVEPHRLGDFLREPRETLNVEIKRWLDLNDRNVQATVARHLMALANHGGGWLQFGFAEGADGQFTHERDTACPDPSSYTTDAFNGIVRRYARPSFQCEVLLEECDQGCPGPHAFVRVPGGHRIPIVCGKGGPEPNPDPRKGAIYTRLVGPRSEAITDPDDWHTLLDACMRERRDELVETIRGAVGLLGASDLRAALGGDSADDSNARTSGSAHRGTHLQEWAASAKRRLDELVEAESDPDPYAHGWWLFAYRVVPPVELSIPQLRSLMLEVVGNETGWPAWRWPSSGDKRDPRPYEQGIECWMSGGAVFTDAAHADFWRASTAGELCLLRGFDEDAIAQLSPQHSHIAPGTVLDPVLAIWRVGECLLHAERLSTRLGADTIEVFVHWSGLKGRSAASLGTHTAWYSSRSAESDSVMSQTVVERSALGATLPQIVHSLTEPLFVLFDFLEVPESVVATELDRLRGRRPT
jgi:hypothetical protein